MIDDEKLKKRQLWPAAILLLVVVAAVGAVTGDRLVTIAASADGAVEFAVAAVLLRRPGLRTRAGVVDSIVMLRAVAGLGAMWFVGGMFSLIVLR